MGEQYGSLLRRCYSRACCESSCAVRKSCAKQQQRTVAVQECHTLRGHAQLRVGGGDRDAWGNMGPAACCRVRRVRRVHSRQCNNVPLYTVYCCAVPCCTHHWSPQAPSPTHRASLLQTQRHGYLRQARQEIDCCHRTPAPRPPAPACSRQLAQIIGSSNFNSCIRQNVPGHCESV